MDNDERIRELAERLKITFPPTEAEYAKVSRRARASLGRSPGETTSSSETPSQTPQRGIGEAAHAASATSAAMNAAPPDATDDSISGISTTEMDVTERGLHRALAQAQIENRALRSQIQMFKDREANIVAIGVRNKEQFAQAKAQLDNIKRIIRTEIRDPITEDTFRRLEALPESQRDLADVIRMVVFEQIGLLSASKRSISEENAVLKRELESTRSAATAAQNRLADEELEHRREVGRLKDEVERITNRCDELQRTLSDAKRIVDSNETKAARYDQVEAELRRVESQLAHAKEDGGTYQAKYNQLLIEHQSLENLHRKTESLLHNTEVEVKYSTKERESLQSRLKDAEAKLSRLTMASEEKESSLMHTSQSAVVERETMRSNMEKQLQAETQRLREQHAEDLEHVRQSTRESSQREQHTLRDALATASAAAAKNRQQLDETRAELELLKQEQLSKREELQRELFEKRLELHAKSNECVGLDLTLRERVGELDRKTVDLQCAEKKLEILKQDFYDQKVKHQEVLLRLEAKLQAQEGQLSMMRELETEAEVFMAHIATSSTADPAAIAAAASAVGGDVPSSRRMAHTLSVTKRALALENQVTLLKHDAGIASLKITKLENDLEMARNALRNTNSPYCLLEENLIRREKEVEQLQSRLEVLRQENEAFERKNKQLDSEVHILSGHRQEVAKIRDLLKQLGIQPSKHRAAEPPQQLLPPTRPAKENLPPAAAVDDDADETAKQRAQSLRKPQFAAPSAVSNAMSPRKPVPVAEMSYSPEDIEIN